MQNIDPCVQEKTGDHKKLLEYGLDPKVADKLDDIYKVWIIRFMIHRAKQMYKMHFNCGFIFNFNRYILNLIFFRPRS